MFERGPVTILLEAKPLPSTIKHACVLWLADRIGIEPFPGYLWWYCERSKISLSLIQSSSIKFIMPVVQMKDPSLCPGVWNATCPLERKGSLFPGSDIEHLWRVPIAAARLRDTSQVFTRDLQPPMVSVRSLFGAVTCQSILFFSIQARMNFSTGSFLSFSLAYYPCREGVSSCLW